VARSDAIPVEAAATGFNGSQRYPRKRGPKPLPDNPETKAPLAIEALKRIAAQTL
jgi:hypothetical protein